jgi:hypothetical protein
MAELFHFGNGLVFGRTDHSTKNLALEIQLKKPYKITPEKHKTYQDHYVIPSASALIIPTRKLGDETACEIRWEVNNQLRVLQDIVFMNENLIPIDLIADEQLYALWKDYDTELNDTKS